MQTPAGVCERIVKQIANAPVSETTGESVKMNRLVPMVQEVQMTREASQSHCIDEVARVPVAAQKRTRIFQIFIRVPGGNAMILDALPNRPVEGVQQEISSKLKCETGELYLIFESRVLRGGDEMQSCGTRDGSTVQVAMNMLSGGRKKVKKKRAARPKRPER